MVFSTIKRGVETASANITNATISNLTVDNDTTINKNLTVSGKIFTTMLAGGTGDGIGPGWIAIGNDAAIGDSDIGGALCIKGRTGTNTKLALLAHNVSDTAQGDGVNHAYFLFTDDGQLETNTPGSYLLKSGGSANINISGNCAITTTGTFTVSGQIIPKFNVSGTTLNIITK